MWNIGEAGEVLRRPDVAMLQRTFLEPPRQTDMATTDVVLKVRVTSETHESLSALARLEHRSITAMARELIDEAIKARQEQGGGSRRREGIQTDKEERIESAFEKLIGRPDDKPERTK